MMETLEQQQTKITSSIEPHVGDTDTTATAASEDDDYEDFRNVTELEEEESSERSQCSNNAEDVVSGEVSLEKEETYPSKSIIDAKKICDDVAIELASEESPADKPEAVEDVPNPAAQDAELAAQEAELTAQDWKPAGESNTTFTPSVQENNEMCASSEGHVAIVREEDVVETCKENKFLDEFAVETVEENNDTPDAKELPLTDLKSCKEGNIDTSEEVSTDNADDQASVTEFKNEDAVPFVCAEAIKIESCSEDEEAEAGMNCEAEVQANCVRLHSSCDQKEDLKSSFEDIKAKLQGTETTKIKVNGAHESHEELQVAVECNEEVTKVKCDEVEAREDGQLAVIENNVDIDISHATNASKDGDNSSYCSAMSVVENEATMYTTVNGVNDEVASNSNSDSSASQQLVIDHPESEQNSRVKPIMLALKRRPSNERSIANDQEPKANHVHHEQGKNISHTLTIEKSDALETEHPSLLMQRLQQPLASTCNAPNILSCFKCNASNFVNFQELNDHLVQCNERPKSVTVHQTATTVANPTQSTATTTPNSSVSLKPERFFRCVRCNTVHQCWNFFLHMRDVHQRYICLYCSHVFATVEKLSLHLENKHDIDQVHLASDSWTALQLTEDRARYLICCTCEATFPHGSRFEDHDCAEFMKPCTLCGQKGCHTNDCRNSSTKAGKRKRKVKRKKVSAETPLAPTGDANIPVPPNAPLLITSMAEPVAEATPAPKLVVPKIMLRVPKEFQKSVDAALSSTDTEEEDLEMEQEPEPEIAGPSEIMQPITLSLEAQTVLSEDTETATETASVVRDTTPPSVVGGVEKDDSPTAKLSRVLAEIERTKMDIQRTKADMAAKKPPKTISAQVEEPPSPAERRWSPTPPASPKHNNHIDAEAVVAPMEQTNLPLPVPEVEQPELTRRNSLGSDCMDIDDSIGVSAAEQPLKQALARPQEETAPLLDLGVDEVKATSLEPESQTVLPAVLIPPTSPPPSDGIVVAPADTHTVDLQLDRPLDKFDMVVFVRICLKAVYPFCLYCNHARRIAVNGRQLLLHIIAQHRFTATVDSITAEELHAETIVAKLKSFLPDLEYAFLNADSYCSIGDGQYSHPFNERIYECFQCRYVTSTHKELYTHNRRLHIKTNILCFMCRTNFYSFSEILCHICPGDAQLTSIYDLKFRCCLCETSGELPSAFRLMVHLRKAHFACDICLEDCYSQVRLSSHVWKHKLLHLCYRCGIAYRNKQDISKHLFWKHGTESTSCKRCLQKRWRHVYHFCVPPAQFTCEHCQFTFSKAIYLEVHKRMHLGDFRYPCTEVGCQQKFVSRRLLLKHAATHEVLAEVQSVEEKSSDHVPKLEDADKQQEIKEEKPDPSTEEHKSTGEAEIPTNDTLLNHEAAVGSTAAEQREQVKQVAEEAPRKRRKKSKRNKESLEDLNLIAPNLSESDSSNDSDSDVPKSVLLEEKLPIRGSVDDLDMPKVMLSPASESDNDNDKEEQEEKETEERKADQKQKGIEDVPTDAEDSKEVIAPIKSEPEKEAVPEIWKNLLQLQASGCVTKEHETEESLANYSNSDDERCPRPAKIHVAISDHDYCKIKRTPPPSPVKEKAFAKLARRARHNSTKRGSEDSDTDSSSSSSSNSDSSSCSCGSNCSCSSNSSSGSSSTDSSSEDSDSSAQTRGSPQKRPRKKSVRGKKGDPAISKLPKTQQQHPAEEDVNVTALSEERPPSPPKPPMYNESDFDTAVSDTDEEFYDAHPQKMASELLAMKRAALLADRPQLLEQSNYDIVENSRPSTPSLPEEAAAYAEKRERAKNKKKKRDRKSTCRSAAGVQQQLELKTEYMTPLSSQPESLGATVLPSLQLTQMPVSDHNVSLLPLTPLTHRLQPTLTRMSEGSSCSDADGSLKRSKRTRRPNKFYGYTSDDENMSSVLQPPLQVGMQLIKPQPPPQLTWAKEDLPTPAKSILNQYRNKTHRSTGGGASSVSGSAASGGGHHQYSNGTPTGVPGSSRKRNKRTLLSGVGDKVGSANRKRPAKRSRPNEQLPPIPTLKIRPALLVATTGVAGSESSDSSSGGEDGDVNVTSLLPATVPTAPHVPSGIPTPQQQHLNSLLPPPPPPPVPTPAATAFNQPIPPALLPNPDFATLQYFKANNIRYPIRPPAGARLAREGESVYCYCRCPYDEVSEMIACDGDNCLIEWFHFECVGIMVAPQGKWFCAECRPKYSEGLYPMVKGK
ncbi:uncharacterized protein LOC115624593 [Scaptodrosophila lebanonensis]|uniref:Uncharacterized protein LOC115624593 n=1 Tax=Drosophila lebanonensis TaxID=7225 RepID=A0A6J2TEJ3_DROLE|nr:uncharacterized protein LOC115624593 [Scaptodrosophila lebanonensis]